MLCKIAYAIYMHKTNICMYSTDYLRNKWEKIPGAILFVAIHYVKTCVLLVVFCKFYQEFFYFDMFYYLRLLSKAEYNYS